MSQVITYTKPELIAMNSSYPWTKCITNINNIQDTESAKLYPTGNAGFCGRIYIALPSNLELTPYIIKKYNLLHKYNLIKYIFCYAYLYIYIYNV